MIKAIETVYNGYKFRSRLEARWAVFFDALGLGFRYESEGFDLNGVWYLPDFFIPQWDTFIEIKPGPGLGTKEHLDLLFSLKVADRKRLVEKESAESHKCRILSEVADKKVIIFRGDIEPKIFTEIYLPKMKSYILDESSFDLRKLGYHLDDDSQMDWFNEYLRENLPKSILGNSTFGRTTSGDKFLAMICHSVTDRHRYAYFPVSKSFAYPEAFSRTILQCDLEFTTLTLDKSVPPSIHTTEDTIDIFAAYNAIVLHRQRISITQEAYTAARQARFEHNQGVKL